MIPVTHSGTTANRLQRFDSHLYFHLSFELVVHNTRPSIKTSLVELVEDQMAESGLNPPN